MKYQDFIPPILSHALKKLRSSKKQTPSPIFFSTYAEAQRACSGAGYEDTDLIEMVFEKTRLAKNLILDQRFPMSDSSCQSLLAALFALQLDEKRKQLSVIDFGGACGAHYFQLRPFLPPDIRVDWMVVETRAMSEKARAFETDELRFCDSLLAAREVLSTVDLLHSSGTLQYVPDPQAVIRELVECQAACIFLNRLVLSASEAVITIQETSLSANGPGALPDFSADRLCRFPVTYFPKRRLEELLSPNYRIKFCIADIKTFTGDKEIYINTGLFAERSR